ncbi:MAG: hypothetical protein M5R42_09545 [Rhodocyclaceae bacterium]|nr:hypothetical protein [Rhodocyclaceae bacterium]
MAGPGQTEAAHELCSAIPAQKKEHFSRALATMSIFSGCRWRETIYPRVRDFYPQQRLSVVRQGLAVDAFGHNASDRMIENMLPVFRGFPPRALFAGAVLDAAALAPGKFSNRRLAKVVKVSRRAT